MTRDKEEQWLCRSMMRKGYCREERGTVDYKLHSSIHHEQLLNASNIAHNIVNVHLGKRRE